MASHRFVTELAAAGARVIHHLAADQAEREGVRLRFTSLHDDGEPSTLVERDVVDDDAIAFAHGAGRRDFPAPTTGSNLATITLVSAAPEVPASVRAAATAAAAHSGISVTGTSQGPHSLRFVVAPEDAVPLLQVLHARVASHLFPRVNGGDSAPHRRSHVGYR